jgi:hypothetical protein
MRMKLNPTPPSLIGRWTWPYKMPPGTKAAQVVSEEAGLLTLSDGSKMHRSYFKAAQEGDVR